MVFCFHSVTVDQSLCCRAYKKVDHHANILGDIIESVNGKEVTNSNDLFKILDLCKEGDKVWLCFHFLDVLMRCVCVGWGDGARSRDRDGYFKMGNFL